MYTSGACSGSATRRRAHRMSPVDPFQEHRQLCRTQMNAPGRCLWPDEAAAFKPLAEQAQAMTIPPEDLDQIAALAAEDEHMAAKGIDLQCCLRNRCQAIKAPAHIGDASHRPDTCTGR